MKFNFPQKLRSRKLWMPVLAGIFVGLNDTLGWDLDQKTVNAIVALAVAYVFGESYVDARRK
jgi:hypothetical protein